MSCRAGGRRAADAAAVRTCSSCSWTPQPPPQFLLSGPGWFSGTELVQLELLLLTPTRVEVRLEVQVEDPDVLRKV